MLLACGRGEGRTNASRTEFLECGWADRADEAAAVAARLALSEALLAEDDDGAADFVRLTGHALLAQVPAGDERTYCERALAALVA